MRFPGRIAVVLTVALALLPAFAQHHASLTSAETDELRDAAMEPNDRLRLYLKFLRDRLDTLEAVRDLSVHFAASRLRRSSGARSPARMFWLSCNART